MREDLMLFFLSFDFLHIMQVYNTESLLVCFDFLFHDFIAGLEYLPLFPKPIPCPLLAALVEEPLDRGCADERDFCFAMLTF